MRVRSHTKNGREYLFYSPYTVERLDTQSVPKSCVNLRLAKAFGTDFYVDAPPEKEKLVFKHKLIKNKRNKEL